MYSKIEKYCKLDGKKYIYAYDEEPDHTMHMFGPDNKTVKDLIRYRNIMTEKLCEKLKDTIIFVVADHGHIKVENIFLKNYPDIVECFRMGTSTEVRATSFFIKEDVLDSNLFGDGEKNELIDSELGDYIAIAKTNKTLIYEGDEVLYSHHAGYTDDEIYVPLIIVDKCE